MKTKPHSNTLFDVLQTLLAHGQVGTQEEIIKALTQQGFSVSQSKVSRLLKKMAAIKINTPRGSIYRLPHQHDLAHELSDSSKKHAFKSLVLQVSANETLIVVRTMPGGAPLVARVLDQEQKNLPILGTIAGDDTVLVIPAKTQMIEVSLQRIKRLLLE